MNIAEQIKEKITSERRVYAPRCNYASSAGHPCPRKLVYDRLNWQDKLLMEPHAVSRVDVGRLLEDYAIEKIKSVGVNVVEQQRPLEWTNLELSGRIEGQIKVNGDLILFEVKSVQDYDFKSVNGSDDLKNNRKWWFRGYFAQFQLYLLLLGKEYGFFFLVSLKGQIKQFRVDLDYAYAEGIAKKLELVNGHVKAKTYPERIEDKTVCEMCDFRHVCLPDESDQALNIVENSELYELLEERENLKDFAKDYEAVDKKIKEGYLKAQQDGDYLVGGKFQITIKTGERKFTNLPDEVKKKYEETKPFTTIKIKTLK